MFFQKNTVKLCNVMKKCLVTLTLFSERQMITHQQQILNLKMILTNKLLE